MVSAPVPSLAQALFRCRLYRLFRLCIIYYNVAPFVSCRTYIKKKEEGGASSRLSIVDNYEQVLLVGHYDNLLSFRSQSEQLQFVLFVHVLYQLSGAVYEIPDHLRKLLDALRLALLRCGRIVGKGGGRRRVSRLCCLERVDLAARLEDCAACSVQDHACLDAGFPNEATKLLLEGVVPVCRNVL